MLNSFIKKAKEETVHNKAILKGKPENKYFGFFHPYATAGGGGERVLWTAIQALQIHNPDYVSVLYTALDPDETKASLIEKIQSKFGLEIKPETLILVVLDNVSYAETPYRRFRLLLQSLGSVRVAYEGLIKFVPDVFIDTVGYAFTYPLARFFFGIPVVSYTHYPTISSDMLQVVASRESGICNDETINSSFILSNAKKVYYKIFAILYGFVGSFADVVMTNSSWTLNHIKKTFKKSKLITLVYPPCDTNEMTKFSLESRQLKIVSLAQFRPEKNHALQVEGFSKFLSKYPKYKMDKNSVKDESNYPKLVIMGGVRNEGDKNRAEDIEKLALKHGIESQVSVVKNASYSTILSELSVATAGLHTMKDEHFGINIVEFMASGAIPIGHKSAGPMMDIIVPAFDLEALDTVNQDVAKLADSNGSGGRYAEVPVGFLATTADEFAEVFNCLMNMNEETLSVVRKEARGRATNMFSADKFRAKFIESISGIL
ncbi:GDP-Man:Man(3)GlcNAc(2)-PP-Dol alpha-1,2-mannosyltransferase [Smittium culicis]|uniref:GDP-Man:Man(3)GlcNAc(2)-PP-Dol alpha-1,2-mannosyltransferase n=2 Tax=Smittium culicis TaxID=133412 RepID=A0A1R1X5I6_9FUNG|nr:GDP-Man:Man(3)GlcNAc(2)-PP-Dol alpha-1,2-mannosyltransferase [Smittium culicis]